jgi:carboxymethylenebutenolidase
MPEIVTEEVSFPANGAEAPGYLARPDDSDSHPGVVVIQEVWGLEEHIKDVVRRFAREGFVAVAPDLYRGKVAIELEEARKIRMALELDQTMRDLQGALTYLKGRADVAPKRLGAIGFCMGGSLTQHIALASSDLGAAAALYGGRGAPEPEELANIQCELLAVYGEEDQGIPMERVEALRAALQRANKPHEIVVYPGAPHAFFNDTRPSYREEAAKDAWRRTLALFRRVLV